ncbi:MAG: hypothetical protein A2V88_17700 [Elusimicrobia bacterium RBG_16_66_12]|nr:MAG: hypothetical protein A2V88_17700 [Elusimicrobia bacterium RBG_16_66_12]
MLYSYGFARLYHLWTSRAAMLSAGNVMGSSVVLATGRVTGTIALSTTDAGTLATANDLANGIQGVSADDLCIRVISGTLTGTIVATGAKQGAASTAYWAGTVATLTSAGTRHLLTGPAGSFCWDVTGLSYNGNGTVATFTVESYGRAL